MNMMGLIETERLILRPFTMDDLEGVYEMNLDEEVSRYTGDGGVVSREEIKRRITEDILGDYEKYGFGRMAVLLKDTDTFIGFAGLKYLDDLDQVDLGYRFMSQYWGKGYATEAARVCVRYAFEVLKLNQIVAYALPQNTASIRVLEKLNFSYEKEVLEDGLIARYYVLKNSESK